MLTFMQDKPELAHRLLLTVIDGNNKRKVAEQTNIDDSNKRIQRSAAAAVVAHNALAAFVQDQI